MVATAGGVTLRARAARRYALPGHLGRRLPPHALLVRRLARHRVALPVLAALLGEPWQTVVFAALAARGRDRPAPAEHPPPAQRHRVAVQPHRRPARAAELAALLARLAGGQGLRVTRAPRRQARGALAIASGRRPPRRAQARRGAARSRPADRTPQVARRPVVHAVYACPPTCADRSPQVAQQLLDDAEQIDAWWRREDPTGRLRFDLFPSRAARSSTSRWCASRRALDRAAPVEGRFERSCARCRPPARPRATRSTSSTTTARPTRSPSGFQVCGQGGSSRTAPASRWSTSAPARACRRAPTAAHEILHGLGAVPVGRAARLSRRRRRPQLRLGDRHHVPVRLGRDARPARARRRPRRLLRPRGRLARRAGLAVARLPQLADAARARADRAGARCGATSRG